MTEKASLKALIVYDAEKNEYTISAHNRNPEEAAQLVEEWGKHLREGCRFLTLDQTRPHSAEPQGCRACRELVRHTSGLAPQPKFRRRKE